jgi:hypothetical protein
MSGRGRGHHHGLGGGRGSTGRGRNTSQSLNTGSLGNTNKPSNKTVSDSIYYLGSAKQAADYESTMDFLINHSKKRFNFGNNIGMSIETLEDYNVDQHCPKLQTSDSVHPETKELENKQFEIEFKAEFDAFMKQKQTLEANTTKADAFLMEQCAKAMQNKIESNSNYKGVLRVIQLSY